MGCDAYYVFKIIINEIDNKDSIKFEYKKLIIRMFGTNNHKSRQAQLFKSLNEYRTGSKYNNSNTIISIPVTTIYTGPLSNI